jgi:hypothetical protein
MPCFAVSLPLLLNSSNCLLGYLKSASQHSDVLNTFINQPNALAVASFISQLLHLCMVA